MEAATPQIKLTTITVAADEEELDFEGFLRLLQANQQEELDQYDARLPRSASHTALASLANGQR